MVGSGLDTDHESEALLRDTRQVRSWGRASAMNVAQSSDASKYLSLAVLHMLLTQMIPEMGSAYTPEHMGIVSAAIKRHHDEETQETPGGHDDALPPSLTNNTIRENCATQTVGSCMHK